MDSAACPIQTDHFEVEQYVRVQMPNGRSEIGVVIEIDEPGKTAVIATRHGYDITVRLSSVRRAFLLVLDLNGVLVARGKGSFVDRPGVEEFIQFVMNNFVVAVWTSGLERTSNPIIDKVLDGYQDRLLFKLYRDSCTVWPTPDKPYRTIKNLQRIFDKYPKSFNAVNTIIVDDSPDKCSHPDIALCPVPFNDPENQMDDNGLNLAMDVLKEVLRLESHAPLIRASEERLVALAAKEKEEHERASRHANEKPSQGEEACEEKEKAEKEKEKAEKEKEPPASRPASHEAPGNRPPPPQEPLQETFLWATRLCCNHILGGCARGGACRFSHDADDGKRPCSRKNRCRHGHARRWTEDPHATAATAAAKAAAATAEPPANPRGVGTGGAKSFDVSSIMSLFTTNPDQQRQQSRRNQINALSPPPPPQLQQQQQQPPPPQQQPPPPPQQQQQQRQQQRPQRQQQQQQQQQQQKHRDPHSRHSKNSQQSNKPRDGSNIEPPRAKVFEQLPDGFDIPMHNSALHREFLLQRQQYCEKHPRRRDGQQPSDLSKPKESTPSVPKSQVIHITGDSSDGSALVRQLQATLGRR